MVSIVVHDSTGFLKGLENGLDLCQLRGKRVLVAVSGGPDSVALWRGLETLAQTFDLKLVAAHLNHQLRGADSEADAAWVQELADARQLKLVVRCLDVSGRVAVTKETIEEAARAMRYGALIEIAQTMDCSAVAVGHSADDQVETVLHHLFRGTGLAGLRGIPRTRSLADGLVLTRPMLAITRAEIVEWLAEIQQPARTDASNADSQFTRNRIRLELLPWLERELNPQVRRAILQLAQQADEAASWLREQATAVLHRVLAEHSEDSLRLDATLLSQESRCVIREVLLLAWQRNNWPMRRMSFEIWQRLADLVLNGGAMHLPGSIDARKRGRLVVMTRPQSTQSRNAD